MTTDYSARLAALANGPKIATGADRSSVATQDIEAVIAAENHINANAAAGKNHFGLRFVRLVNTGPAGFQ